LIEPDGLVSEAGEAVARLLAIGGRRAPLWIYERIPGCARTAEFAYRLIAEHRPFWAAITTALWGRTSEPSTYARTTWLFLRLLGIVYLLAFVSLGRQIVGLVGRHGLLPADVYLEGARQLPAAARLWLLPTVAWFDASDAMLLALCYGGAALSALLVIGVAPLLMLVLMWTAYLSLSVVCQDFLSYQWDALLLETGFLAIFLAPLTRFDGMRRLIDPPRPAVWLMCWLLFRLMVSSGAVKLTSGDPTWRDLTALAYHFETQPIPTPPAWYAHWLPPGLLKASTAAVFAVEIVLPFFLVAPRRLRALMAVPLIGLQALIAFTGNYAFFNLLTAALCLFMLDDAALGRWGSVARPGEAGRARRWVLVLVAVITVPVSVLAFSRALGVRPPGAQIVYPLARVLSPLRSVNGYGLFAVMTTTRREIVIEGSADGTMWVEYEFPYKPGDVHRRPPWVAPHQPRLDWQMWFAALGRPEDEPSFQRLLLRLLEGEPGVLALLARDPFEGRPPRYVRALLYRYQFATAEERRRDGAWWRRELLGIYVPELTLDDASPR
jgi:hypothetical protein